MQKNAMFYISLIVVVLALSCGRKETSNTAEWDEPRTENVKRESYKAAPPPENAQRITATPRYDEKGAILLSDTKFYGAVVPKEHELLHCADWGCRIAVQMSRGEVESFLRQNFPGRKLEYKEAVNTFLLHAVASDEDDVRPVVPTIDPSIEPPKADSDVKIEAAWVAERSRYEFQYHNPSYKEEVPVKEFESKDGEETENIEH
ncbi:MAG: hypothetical protein ACOX8U_03665 [Bradymonadia bacterium]|jgi:hypothetical protein